MLQADWDAQYEQQAGAITKKLARAKQGVENAAVEAQAFDRQALIWNTDASPLDVQMRRTEALVARLKLQKGVRGLAGFETELRRIRELRSSLPLARSNAVSSQEKELYASIMTVQRAAALSSAVLDDFTDILFAEIDICSFAATDQTAQGLHGCDQYFGCNGKPGGGLYLLKNYKTAPTVVNLLQNSVVQSGRLAGQKLVPGAFLSPELSFDGKTILFARSIGSCKVFDFSQDADYHIFKVNIDGTNLVQLTDGPYNDFDPCYLPGGRIAFISDRRGGYGRCHGRPVPTYTLYSMKDNGTDIIQLSSHETNEWQPSVANDGRLAYTRWDYIDRDAVIAHHLWICYPDGRDPRSYHGNYPNPQTTVSGSGWLDGRYARPDVEAHIRSIPGTMKYVATAAPHHSQFYGSLVIINPDVVDDNAMSQVQRLTPEEPFAEVESPAWGVLHKYGTAWPLSQDQYLCNYQYSIVLLDKLGTRQVLYTTKTNDNGITGGTFGFRPVDPIPIVARTMPPVLPVQTCQGQNLKPTSPNATIFIANVYVTDSFGTLPAGVKIKQMRIVQVLPKTTFHAFDPVISIYGQALARMPLGTVPVETDGSVYCEAPVGKEIYFQLLDSNGMAVQSMRSGTYVHPGEQMACTGCHEDKWKAVPPFPNPIALKRPPSRITPEVIGIEPINYYRHVKPVFNARCASCHRDSSLGKGPDFSYASLKEHMFGFEGVNLPALNLARYGGSRVLPGRFGALESYLYKHGHLKPAHHGVRLTAGETRRITLWLDLNSNELGSYENADAQKLGKNVWPRLDVDTNNLQGVERRAVTGSLESSGGRVAPQCVLRAHAGAVSVALPSGGPYSIIVTTLSGRTVCSEKCTGVRTLHLPMQGAAGGLYFVNVYGVRGSFGGRFVLY